MDDETIGHAVQKLANSVCGNLREGWKISIQLERNAGWVDLFNPDDELRDTGPVDCDESIVECVLRLVETANNTHAHRAG